MTLSRAAGRSLRRRACTCLASATVCSPKWKMLAASTASALPSVDALDQVLERADTARGDHRNVDGRRDGRGQRDVVAVLRAVAVHRGQQDLAGAEALAPRPPTRRRRAPSGCGRRGCRPRTRSRCRRCCGRRSPPRSTGAPNSRLISETSSGRFTAAVLTLTLSAPARSSRRVSSTVRMPPPIVNGMKHLLGDGSRPSRPSCRARPTRR